MIAVIGGGITGLAAALNLNRRGIACRVYERASEVKELGVGITLLPHAMRELTALGLGESLAAQGIENAESCFFNRFGQLIYSDPCGRYAGYEWPQFSIHRGDLQNVLLDAFRERVGADRLHTGWKCTRVENAAGAAHAHFVAAESDEERETRRADVVVGCDGLHSTVRKQLHPN